MQEIKSLAEIGEDFKEVLNSLTTNECESNRKLVGKTKKIALLLGRVTKVIFPVSKIAIHSPDSTQEVRGAK